jgi:hypothetical protein
MGSGQKNCFVEKKCGFLLHEGKPGDFVTLAVQAFIQSVLQD